MLEHHRLRISSWGIRLVKVALSTTAAVLTTLGTPANAGQDATQWAASEGGNGHWYAHQIVEYPAGTPLCGVDWLVEYASEQGGYPITITSAEEEAFALQVLPFFNGTYSTANIGLYRDNPASPWTWVTGEIFDYSNFIGGVSNGQVVHLYDEESQFGPGWRRGADCFSVEDVTIAEGMSTIVEWSADCNGDGVVDYGQILNGELRDLDGDGVPDICHCLADVNNDGMVDAADLGILLAFWGDPATFPAADLTDDGQVDGADLGVLFLAWGPCG